MKKYLLLLLTLGSSVVSAESYLCIPDRSTGFAYNKNTKIWYTTSFNVSDKKYLLSISDGKWKWKTIGDSEFSYLPCGEFNEYGYISCLDLMQVTFNRKNLRFLLTYNIGYTNYGIAGNEGDDEPHMEIGRCSKI